MHPTETFIKGMLDNKQLSANFYNDHIVTAVEQKIIKDITPKNVFMEPYQVVGAVIEFSDGSQYRITIWNPPDLYNPQNKYNYQYECKKVSL